MSGHKQEEEEKPRAQPTSVISGRAVPFSRFPTAAGQAPYVMFTPQGTVCAIPNPGTFPVMPTPSQIFFAPMPTAMPQAVPMTTTTAPGPLFLSPYGQFLSGHPMATQMSPHLYMPVQHNRMTSPPSSASPTTHKECDSPHSSNGSEPTTTATQQRTNGTTTVKVQKETNGNPQRITYSQSEESKPITSPAPVRVLGHSQKPQVIQPSPVLPPHSTTEPAVTITSAANPSTSTTSPSPILSRIISRGQRSKLQPAPGSSSLEKLLTSRSEQEWEHDPLYPYLQDEPHFINFYRFFHASEDSEQLRLRVLSPEGDTILKWLEVTRRVSHIDPNLGPVDTSRILISSNGLCKLQLLFPYYKNIFTKFMPTNQQEADELFSELSPKHVLCPGLPDYADKFTVLGYHPSHVRVLETPFLKRYDHKKCSIWHIPSNMYSKSGHILHTMCKHCRSLQNNLVRLATKACEIDPAEREAWTDPSSNRPLAYMSAADREERYRKLRQERTHLLNKLKAYEERLGIKTTATLDHKLEGEEQGDVAVSPEEVATDNLITQPLPAGKTLVSTKESTNTFSGSTVQSSSLEPAEVTTETQEQDSSQKAGRKRASGPSKSRKPPKKARTLNTSEQKGTSN